MSATAPMASVLPPAPWKSLFNQHLSKMQPPEFVLSTVAAAPAGSPTPYVPRARYCIFRGFWTELPENEHNDAERNPEVYQSDCPTFTTDVRMEKVGQIFGSSAGHAESTEQVQGSGGGGPVEAVWWIKETGTQWRVSGRAYIVADDIESKEESSGVRTVKSELGKRMRIVDESKLKDWSWTRELTGTFGNQSPGIKGSFRAPPPGKAVDEPYDDKNLELGAKVSDLHDTVARKNYRLVVIVPDAVEQTDISDPAKARRFRYTFDGNMPANSAWKTEELWP
ncbi:pyridoxamine 5'-phosphate oxidase-domain-containing protein [Massariosphaeria phaeospora]|uniref:Pyridoxamine 5'-phosphate oxidase-domain-containing protein n=1 Tax=Massariosphaeria phaeospora TaxID=100035 RepID=A0A7C8IC45_9PLEO|nr:pyridoxamine 5'-phosphate oxidase-domain-containing protein [Massariosphaeria phaeospora]